MEITKDELDYVVASLFKALDVLKSVSERATEAKGQDLPCDGCKYYHKGSHDCMLDAPNNCIRQAEDFYTKAEPKGNRPQEGK